MRRWLLAALLLTLAGSACAPDPPDPHLSTVALESGLGAVIVLTNGEVWRCAYAKETGTGWECWGGWGKDDWKARDPRAYWPRAQVASVVASPDGSHNS